MLRGLDIVTNGLDEGLEHSIEAGLSNTTTLLTLADLLAV
jgi:hypothetical protein